MPKYIPVWEDLEEEEEFELKIDRALRDLIGDDDLVDCVINAVEEKKKLE